MNARLLELKRAKPVNARVLLCTGTDGKELFGPRGLPGIDHAKVLCINNGEVVWHGGANATKSSRKNVECMSRITGPATQQFVSGLSRAAANSEQLPKGRAAQM